MDLQQKFSSKNCRSTGQRSRRKVRALVSVFINHRFLLVKSQLDYILDKEGPREAMAALQTLPVDMPDAYAELLGRIEKTNRKRTAVRVLSWLFHARQPMNIDEIREVISIETQPPDTHLDPNYFINPTQIIHSCQGLVELDHTNKVIQFTHYTVQEF